MASYLAQHHTWLQNAADIITKWDNYFNTKCDKNLSQNVSGFLLQNATVFIQTAIIIIKCDDFLTKCDYKMRRLL